MLDSGLIDIMSDFSHAIEAAQTVAELEHVLEQTSKSVNVEMFSYHHLPPIGSVDYIAKKIVCDFGFPDAWRQFYASNDYVHDDPLINYVFEKNQVVNWKDVLALDPKNKREQDYLQTVSQLNIATGIIFPVFGPRNRSGVFSMAFTKGCRPANPVEISMIQWACQAAHYRYVDLIEKTSPAINTLTQRETEILRLIAKGQSNTNIAGTLNISKHTVNGYLKTIFIKLDVSDRVSASFRAVSQGLI